MGKLRRSLSFANVASGLALFVALATGGAYAATELVKNEVKSKHIKNAGVKNADLANDGVTSPKVANGSLLGEDFAAGQLPVGERGPEGARGPAGSPDTPAQVLGKLREVDGASSGLNADQLDGINSTDLPRRVYETSISWNPGSVTQGACTNTSHNVPVDIRTTDHVLVTGGFKGGYNLSGQLTGFVGEIDDVYPTICNNGPASTIDPPEITVNILVLR